MFSSPVPLLERGQACSGIVRNQFFNLELGHESSLKQNGTAIAPREVEPCWGASSLSLMAATLPHPIYLCSLHPPGGNEAEWR